MSNTKTYPPSMPLNIGKFHHVTGGKNTHREELLELFFLNCEECVAVMERNVNEDASRIWSDALDELKNISSRIGAEEIAKACEIAERIVIATEEEKKKIILAIKNHIQRLRAFVRNTGY